jgi:pyrroline-5-carboxylate reductase
MKKNVITFIGGGNMAKSLIGGLIDTGFSAENIRVSDINPEPMAAHFPVEQYTDNNKAIINSDVVVFAVKPQVLSEVAKSLSAFLPQKKPLFISIVAGVRIVDLERWLGSNLAIVRVMPNTPALVQSGASALFANRYVTEYQKELAENILRAVGLTIWLDDELQMDAVTALSGSGPAYFFLLMEVLEKAGVNLGLPQKTARLLTLQTAFGAAKMALSSGENVKNLRAKVTSKGGTTEQAVAVLEEGELQALFNRALQAAQQRAVDLAKQFGEQS